MNGNMTQFCLMTTCLTIFAFFKRIYFPSVNDCRRVQRVAAKQGGECSHGAAQQQRVRDVAEGSGMAEVAIGIVKLTLSFLDLGFNSSNCKTNGGGKRIELLRNKEEVVVR